MTRALRRHTALLLAASCCVAGLAACGPEPTNDDPGATSAAEENSPYRLTVSSSRGSTDAARASVCGKPSSPLIDLPCGISLGFVRNNAPRLYTGRLRDRLVFDLERPASAIFVSFAHRSGDRGLVRRSALMQLRGSGTKVPLGIGELLGDMPTVREPTFLSVLVIYEDDMPAPHPAASGVPDDAVIEDASAEFLVQLATRRAADEP